MAILWKTRPVITRDDVVGNDVVGNDVASCSTNVVPG